MIISRTSFIKAFCPLLSTTPKPSLAFRLPTHQLLFSSKKEDVRAAGIKMENKVAHVTLEHKDTQEAQETKETQETQEAPKNTK